MDEEPRALFTHCGGHKTSLASGDSIKGCQILKDALSFANEEIKLIKKSPKRTALFEQIKKEIGEPCIGGIRKLCPTRWTVKVRNLLFLASMNRQSLSLNVQIAKLKE